MDFQLTEQQRLLQVTVRDLAERELRPRAAALAESGEFPWENVRKLAEIGVMGVTVPEAYGGYGGTLFDAVLVLEQVARVCYVTAMAVLGEVGVQCQCIVHYGTEEQRHRYLPGIARGETICAICISEPNSGSDAGSLATTATLDGDHYVLNGVKSFVSRGDVAHLLVVYARFGDAPRSRGVGAILVDGGTPGMRVGKLDRTMGGEYLAEVIFDNCRVPAANLLVREEGFKRMMTAFNGQRCLNAAICLGLAQGAFDEALKYSRQRRQFGQEIAQFQGIQWKLADMHIQLEAARLLIYRAACNAAGAFPSMVEAAAAKAYANEMAIRVTNEALQIHGTYGYLREFPVERLLRGARFGAVAGGTPEIQRNLIARHLLRSVGPIS